jgi:hypothetical protein
MAISQTTIKRLFTKSRNECAMPRCTSPLIVGDYVLGEICHIRARRKKGPRYDPTLGAKDRDELANLILLCPTCHTLVDKDAKTYTIELLRDIRELYERGSTFEITPEISRQALLILERHQRLSVNGSPVTTASTTIASSGGVAISVGGHNLGSIKVNSGRSKSATSGYPTNSIGADANMTNYVEYLCQLYVDYMQPTGIASQELWARLGRAIKTRFRLRKRTRNHLSAERFPELVRYLIDEKVAKTPVGKKHLARGSNLCRSFDEFRHSPM